MIYKLFNLKIKIKIMRTRPVFESFGDFVNHMALFEAEEGDMTFNSFISSLSTFLDATAQEGFKAARDVAQLAPEIVGDSILARKIREQLSESLLKLQKKFQKATKVDLNKELGVTVSEATITEVKSFEYKNIVNGKILMAEKIRPEGTELQSLYVDLEGNEKQGYMDIYDAFSAVNLCNITYCRLAAEMKSGRVNKGDKKGQIQWLTDGARTGEETAMVPDAELGHFDLGPNRQMRLVSTATGFTFSSKPDAEMISSLKVDVNQGKPGDKTLYRNLYLYGIEKYNPTAEDGNPIPADKLVKKEMIKITGATKDYTIPIDANDALFSQGSSTLNPEKELEIDQLLTSVLAPLEGLPESITILGGASYETNKDDSSGGGPKSKINQDLVDERAVAIKNRLESLYPSLVKNAEGKPIITAIQGDYSKIQPDNDSSKYEEFRKVFITIKGVVKADTTFSEKTYYVDQELKAGTATIKLYNIAITYTNDKIGTEVEKEKK